MSIYHSSSAEYNAVIKASPGMLRSASFVPGSGGGDYLMIFDATSVPVDGAVTPIAVISLSGLVVPLQGGGPIFFANGIVVAASSTGPFSKTTPGGPAGFIRAEYE